MIHEQSTRAERKPWNDMEDKVLLNSRRYGFPYKYVACALDRTPASVVSRYVLLQRRAA